MTVNDGERFEPLGSSESVSPEPGEIIYYDDGSNNVMFRAWNSRSSKASLVQPSTKTAVIFIDSLLTVSPHEEIEAATFEGASLVKEHCAATSSLHFLSNTNLRFEVNI